MLVIRAQEEERGDREFQASLGYISEANQQEQCGSFLVQEEPDWHTEEAPAKSGSYGFLQASS